MDNNIKKIIAGSYNKNSQYRDNNRIADWKKDEVNYFIKKMNELKINNILDLGAGSGIFGKYFEDKEFNVKCIDISEGMINLCLNRGLDAKVMDFYDMTFENNSFEAIWSMNTLLHVPKKSLKIILKEIKRVLKDDGIFYMGLYGGRSSEGIWENDFYEPHRYFSFYEDEEIKEIISEIFEIDEFKSRYGIRDGFSFQSMILKKNKKKMGGAFND